MPDFSPEALRRHAQVLLMDTAERTQGAQGQQQPEHGKKGLWASLGVMGAGQVADAVSTHQAIQRGAHEQNPIYGKDPGLGRLLATKAAITIPSGFALMKLHTHHPKLANALALGIGGAGMGLAVHNARQGKQE